MSEYKRVQLPNGSQATVTNVKDGQKVLADVDAVDRNGRPLPPTQPTEAGEPAQKPYLKWNNADLVSEIERRNDAGYGDAPEIVVDPSATKKELAAALEADDIRRAS